VSDRPGFLEEVKRRKVARVLVVYLAVVAWENVSDLRVLLAMPGLTTTWELRMDPICDPLRERPDFQALIAEGA
jgi:hypothetical protein